MGKGKFDNPQDLNRNAPPPYQVATNDPAAYPTQQPYVHPSQVAVKFQPQSAPINYGVPQNQNITNIIQVSFFPFSYFSYEAKIMLYLWNPICYNKKHNISMKE